MKYEKEQSQPIILCFLMDIFYNGFLSSTVRIMDRKQKCFSQMLIVLKAPCL